MNEDNNLMNEAFFERQLNDEEKKIIDELVKDIQKALRTNKKDVYVKNDIIRIKGNTLLNNMSSIKMNDSVEGIILRKYYDLKPKVNITITYYKIEGKIAHDFKNKKSKEVNYRIGAGLIYTPLITISVKKSDKFKVGRVIKNINNKEASYGYEKLSEEQKLNYNETNNIEVLSEEIDNIFNEIESELDFLTLNEGIVSALYSSNKVKSLCKQIGQHIAIYDYVSKNFFTTARKIIQKENQTIAFMYFKYLITINYKATAAVKTLNELMKNTSFENEFKNITSIPLTVNHKTEFVPNLNLLSGNPIGFGITSHSIKIDLVKDNLLKNYTEKILYEDRKNLIKSTKTIIKNSNISKEYEEKLLNKIDEFSNDENNKILSKYTKKFLNKINEYNKTNN